MAEKAFHELIRILEDAVRVDADGIEIEWEGYAVARWLKDMGRRKKNRRLRPSTSPRLTRSWRTAAPLRE